MSEAMTDLPTTLLARLLTEQRQRWAWGDRVRVEGLLRQHPELGDDPEAVLDLIYQEVFLRERQGQTPERDEYLQRFPQLADALIAQFDVHQAIQTGPVPEPEAALPAVPGYELLEEIGRGGMGRVFRARDEQRGNLVAVKLLRARDLRKRFVAETRAVAALDHPHIIKILEVGECEVGPFFAMELIEGSSLAEVITQDTPDPVQAVAWLIPVTEAVHYAHVRGIIHRDLKPANIMIDAAGRPRIMDFGMAKILTRAGLTRQSSTKEGTILGTPAYMPPEQAGAPGVRPGPYSDVYSLGAILYALLTGRPPFDGGNFMATLLQVRSAEPPAPVRSLRPDVPERLERICHKCLNKNPADRYAEAGRLAEELRRCHRVAGRAARALPAYLAEVATGQLIPLVKATTIVGRSAQCDLVLQGPQVSRRHCRIVRTPAEIVVEDLGSLQGTRVNGARVTRAALRNGDRLEIAKQVFQLFLRRPRQIQ
jgi:predicted Ser/Thr protein kinase